MNKRLNKKNFAPLFGDWWGKIEPLFDNGVMEGIYSYLKERASEGHTILPMSNKTLRCFQETKLSDLKVVICGLCPYHSIMYGVPIADGLAMSCSNTGLTQPTLEQLYGALEKEFNEGMCLKCYKNPDLSYLSHQGVFLFNAALTVEKDRPGGHSEIWRPFTRYIFEHIISTTGVPVVFLGKYAQEFQRYLAPMQWSFLLQHPAAASRVGDDWDSLGTFTKVNKILKDSNNTEVQWLQERKELVIRK